MTNTNEPSPQPATLFTGFLRADKWISIPCWILIGIAYLALIIVASGRSSAFASEQAGEMLGLSLSLLAITFLIWRVIFKQRKNVSLIIFTVLFVFTAAFKAYSVNYENLKEKQLTQSLIHSMEGGAPVDNGNPAALLLQQYIQETNAQWSKMEAELAEGMDAEPLSADILSHPEKIKASKLRMQRNTQIVEKYRPLLLSMPDAFSAKITALAQDDVTRSFIKGFNQAKDNGIAATHQLLDTYKQAYQWIYQILDFLEQKQGKYTVVNDQVTFQDDADLQQYNSYVVELQKTLKLQEELLERNAAKVSDGVKKLSE